MPERDLTLAGPAGCRRCDERGFALVGAMIIALLFFALVSIILMESIAAFRSAQLFRGRIVAHNLAESGAELAAASMQLHGAMRLTTELDEGSIVGEYRLTPTTVPQVMDFEIIGTGTTRGSIRTTSIVRVYGKLFPTSAFTVEQTRHEQ